MKLRTSTAAGALFVTFIVATHAVRVGDSFHANRADPGGFRYGLLPGTSNTLFQYLYMAQPDVLVFQYNAVDDGCVDVTELEGTEEWLYDYGVDASDFLTSKVVGNGVKFTPEGMVGDSQRISSAELSYPDLYYKDARFATVAVRHAYYHGVLRPECYNSTGKWNSNFRTRTANLPLGNPHDPQIQYDYWAYFAGNFVGTHLALQATRGYQIELILADLPLTRQGKEGFTEEKAHDEIMDAAINYMHASLKFEDGDPEAQPYWDRALANATAARFVQVHINGGAGSSVADLLRCMSTEGSGCKTYYDKWLARLGPDDFRYIDAEWMPHSEAIPLAFTADEMPDMQERVDLMSTMMVTTGRQARIGAPCGMLLEQWDPIAHDCRPPTAVDYASDNYVIPYFMIDGVREPITFFATRERIDDRWSFDTCYESEGSYGWFRLFAGANNVTLDRFGRRCSTADYEYGEEVFMSSIVMYVEAPSANYSVYITHDSGNPDIVWDTVRTGVVCLNYRPGLNRTVLIAQSESWSEYCRVRLQEHPILPGKLVLASPANSHVRVDYDTRELVIDDGIAENPWNYVVDYELAPRKVRVSFDTPGFVGEWRGEGPECPSVHKCLENERLEAMSTDPAGTYNPNSNLVPCTSGFYSYCSTYATDYLSYMPVASPR